MFEKPKENFRGYFHFLAYFKAKSELSENEDDVLCWSESMGASQRMAM
jgi:hypothetical protein